MRLIKPTTVLLMSFLFISSPIFSATTPAKPGNPITFDLLLKKISSMKVKDFQKISGRKLLLKEKIGFGILKHKIKKNQKNEKAEGKGKLSLIMGIAGITLLIIGLYVPILLIPSLASAIVAVVMGSVAKKRNPDDRQAHAGKLLGWITLGLLTLLTILVVIFISSWELSWG